MDWHHLHLALNHLPVIGTPCLLALLLWAWRRRQTETLRFALWLFVVLAAVSIGIKFTGDFAYEAIGKNPVFEHAIIDRHEQAADQATTGVFAMGVAAVVALFVSRTGRKMPSWALVLLALAALVTVVLMARTANLGGQIRHPEIRPVATSAHE